MTQNNAIFAANFPARRENRSETGSHETGSTTIQFLRLSSLIEHGQKAPNVARKRGFSFGKQGGRLGQIAWKRHESPQRLGPLVFVPRTFGVNSSPGRVGSSRDTVVSG